MPKWFMPAAILCGVLFALSPFVIASADYESTMGLVQKIFYYHMPSAWMFLVSGIVCGVASVRFLMTNDPRHDRLAWAAAEVWGMSIDTQTPADNTQTSVPAAEPATENENIVNDNPLPGEKRQTEPVIINPQPTGNQ